ncbi:hypothetical protein FRB94_005833 [Tulasnella sp. JGI-2019a]|nr:hypothetical protein FRB94_005833 [Tulasnella sp. JGI-2019a]
MASVLCRRRTGSVIRQTSAQPPADRDYEEASRLMKRKCTAVEASAPSASPAPAETQLTAGVPRDDPPVSRSLRNRTQVDYTRRAAQMRAVEGLKLRSVRITLKGKQSSVFVHAPIAPMVTAIPHLVPGAKQEVTLARPKKSAKKAPTNTRSTKAVVAQAHKKAASVSEGRKVEEREPNATDLSNATNQGAVACHRASPATHNNDEDEHEAPLTKELLMDDPCPPDPMPGPSRSPVASDIAHPSPQPPAMPTDSAPAPAEGTTKRRTNKSYAERQAAWTYPLAKEITKPREKAGVGAKATGGRPLARK